MNKTITLSERELKRLLSVKHASAKDDIRPILQSIYFNKNEVCALDGYRLAKRITDNNINFNEYILNAEDLKEVYTLLRNKNDNVNIIDNNNNAIEFNIERLKMTIPVNKIDGEYVNYNQFLNPDYKYKVDLNKEQLKALKDSIKQCDKIIQLNLIDNHLYISDLYLNKIVNKIELNIKSSYNEPIEFYIGVNKRYLKEALSNYKECSIFFNSSINPINITSLSDTLNTENDLDLVLPVRIMYDALIEIPEETETIENNTIDPLSDIATDLEELPL